MTLVISYIHSVHSQIDLNETNCYEPRRGMYNPRVQSIRYVYDAVLIVEINNTKISRTGSNSKRSWPFVIYGWQQHYSPKEATAASSAQPQAKNKKFFTGFDKVIHWHKKPNHVSTQ